MKQNISRAHLLLKLHLILQSCTIKCDTPFSFIFLIFFSLYIFKMYSYDLKIRVVNTYIKFKRSRKVATMFQVHHSTVCRWIKCIIRM